MQTIIMCDVFSSVWENEREGKSKRCADAV